jgi:hypothetical protein
VKDSNSPLQKFSATRIRTYSCFRNLLLHERMFLNYGESNIFNNFILLTVYLDVILVNDQLDALFSMYLFHASTSFE